MTVDDQVLSEDAAPADAAPRPAARLSRPKAKRKRRPVKRATIWLHRWSSMVLGLVLLLITTTGAIVVYSPDWNKWTGGDLYEVTSSAQPLTFQQAIDVVNKAHPDFKAANINVYSGLYEVSSLDDDAHPGFYGVDPGSGKITGYGNHSTGFMALMNQIHECFFTCKDYPLYQHWLENPVFKTGGPHWLKDVTWAGVFLGVSGLLLLFLGISGIWLWWPGIKRMAHGFRVRWKKGRYARDYDLHQVIGMIAIPFLLMWGLTGSSFEFHFVKTAWYAVTGGEQPKDQESITSNEVKDKNAKDIGLDAAIAAARTEGRAGDAKLVYASQPGPDDATATYFLYFSKGLDQYEYGSYPGEYGVSVDRHDASHVGVQDYGHAATLSNQLLDHWGAAMFHYGQSVNWAWRIPWFLFGLTPLLLAITGMSTWLAKRSVRKRRKKAQQARAAAQHDEVVSLPEAVAAGHAPDAVS